MRKRESLFDVDPKPPKPPDPPPPPQEDNSKPVKK